MVSVAIAGASQGSTPFSANLGARFANALLAKQAKVKVLLRAESKVPAELESAGAELVRIDYSDAATLERALQGVNIVISALSGPGLAVQLRLAEAAKKAGVRLFVPSEFGDNTLNVSLDGQSPHQPKRKMHDELKRLDLPYALIFNGPFADFTPFFAKNGKLRIVGDGNALVSFTALDNLAAFLAHILTELPLDQLAWSNLPIEDARLSFNDFAEFARDRDPNVQIEYESVESAQTRWETEHDFVAFLQAAWALHGTVGPVAELKNGLYPGWKKVDPLSFV